jgi:hypothetical protein
VDEKTSGHQSQRPPAYGEQEQGSAHPAYSAWPEPRELVLAREALDLGWTVERVIQALRARIRRDEQYLAYRRSRGFYTPTDEAIAGDLRALALAAYVLASTPDTSQ